VVFGFGIDGLGQIIDVWKKQRTKYWALRNSLFYNVPCRICIIRDAAVPYKECFHCCHISSNDGTFLRLKTLEH